MTNWWRPSADHGGVDDKHRLEVLTALKGISDAVNLALDGNQQWAEQGRAVWAMRQLQALRGAEEELRGLRAQLCADARDAGISLREIAAAAGTTHATVRKWASDAGWAEQDAPRSQNPWEDNSSRPRWALEADDIRELARQASIDAQVAESFIADVAAGKGWKRPDDADDV